MERRDRRPAATATGNLANFESGMGRPPAETGRMHMNGTELLDAPKRLELLVIQNARHPCTH